MQGKIVYNRPLCWVLLGALRGGLDFAFRNELCSKTYEGTNMSSTHHWVIHSVTKLSPKKWGISGTSSFLLATLFAGVSILLNQGIDIRANISAVLGLAILDAILLGGSCLAQISSFWPPYKRRICVHEAGHLLIAYLMSCPIRGVILDPIVAMQMGIQGQAGTQFWDEKLENKLAEGRLSGTAFDRYCMVLFAGIAAEALIYGEAEGGENDENLFRSISVLLEPPLSVAQLFTIMALIRLRCAGNEAHYCIIKQGQYVHLDDLCEAHIFLYEHFKAEGRFICSSHHAIIYDVAKMVRQKWPEYYVPTELPRSVLELSKKMIIESSRNPMAAAVEKEAGWMLLSSLLACMPKEDQVFDILSLWASAFQGIPERHISETKDLQSNIRRALMALRGLVRLKSLVDGPTTKRETANALKCMQTLSQVQSPISCGRIRMLEENRAIMQKNVKELRV
ncbi:Dihydroflavonol-4-reductase [Capsicum baccatum]|uniref:Dihydroflavonol-4-reductase n=1 Tax=Capsicum baccatum TaxID=33114 RepID=A0A2G2XBL2_CAPBA|nr:Dihydroflavonol-4-reductase [Capsicum baccatum]